MNTSDRTKEQTCESTLASLQLLTAIASQALQEKKKTLEEHRIKLLRLAMECHEEMHQCLSEIAKLHPSSTDVIEEVETSLEAFVQDFQAYVADQEIGKDNASCRSEKTIVDDQQEHMSQRSSSAVEVELQYFQEVKKWSYQMNKQEEDKVKPGKQLQVALNKLLIAGVEEPVTIGLLVEGHHAKVYRMVKREKLD